ncbi:MAG: CHAD domain-containing protein [Ignavibacteria bacterium]|nr:CHAD domain-containing protein [Ignavibacteria bacterium]
MVKVSQQEIFDPKKNLLECLSIIFNARITKLYSYTDRVFEEEDVEALHDMRVSARRLQAVFKIFKGLFLKKEYKKHYTRVRGVVKLLGKVRELDVTIGYIINHINKSTVEDKRILFLLLARIKKQNLYERKIISENEMLKDFATHEVQLLKFMDDNLLNPEMSSTTDTDYDKSFRDYAYMIIPAMYDRVMEYKNSVVGHPGRKEELHRMRIQTKPLRYALETYQNIFAEDFRKNFKAVKSFVERIGTIHDIDVLIPVLKEYMEEINIYNSNFVNKLQKIPTVALLEFIRKLNTDRKQNFEELCDILRKWESEDFRQKLIMSMENEI